MCYEHIVAAAEVWTSEPREAPNQKDPRSDACYCMLLHACYCMMSCHIFDQILGLSVYRPSSTEQQLASQGQTCQRPRLHVDGVKSEDRHRKDLVLARARGLSFAACTTTICFCADQRQLRSGFKLRKSQHFGADVSHGPQVLPSRRSPTVWLTCEVVLDRRVAEICGSCYSLAEV